VLALVKRVQHWKLKDQIVEINSLLRGHYQYYGLGGNGKSLEKVERYAKKQWREMLSRRSQKGKMPWPRYNEILKVYPIARPKLSIPYSDQPQYVVPL